jgi:hypothetical protein
MRGSSFYYKTWNDSGLYNVLFALVIECQVRGNVTCPGWHRSADAHPTTAHATSDRSEATPGGRLLRFGFARTNRARYKWCEPVLQQGEGHRQVGGKDGDECLARAPGGCKLGAVERILEIDQFSNPRPGGCIIVAHMNEIHTLEYRAHNDQHASAKY